VSLDETPLKSVAAIEILTVLTPCSNYSKNPPPGSITQLQLMHGA